MNMTSPFLWQTIPAFAATLGLAMADTFLPTHSQPPPIQSITLAQRNLRVTLSGAPIQAGWRLRGEESWRSSGSLSPRLYEGEHWVEFRPVSGWVTPPPVLKEITIPEAALTAEYTAQTPPSGSGFISATHTPPIGGWRISGGNPSWIPSGNPMPNLPPGPTTIEFQPVTGYLTPPNQSLGVFPGQGTATRATYHPVPANSTWAFSPLSPDSTNARHISKAPFCYLGKIDSPFGTFTGVAIAQYTVLTTLRAVYDFEKNRVSPNPDITWSWAHDSSFGINEPLTPAGFVFPVDLNSGSLRNPENQIVAIYFRTPVANGGHSGHHPYLELDRKAIFTGYQVTAGNPIAVSTAEVPVPLLEFSNTVLFSIPNLHLADGLVGAPLLTRRSDNRWYPAAMHLGNGQFRRIDTSIDSSIETMIRVAEEAALRGKGGTFSEGKRLGSQFGIDTPKKGKIRTLIAGPSSGQWGLVGYVPNNLSGNELEVDVGQPEVQFSVVSGYQEPLKRAVTVVEGTTAELMVAYLSLVTSWDSNLFSSEQKALGNTGPLDDFDNDGIDNLLEWAFGLDPTNPNLWQQGSGPPGMPVIETKPDGAAKRLEVRFIRRKNAGVLGVHYEAQFSSELHQNWQAINPRPEDVESINDDWERVTVSDRDAPSNALQRFARVSVREVAAP